MRLPNSEKAFVEQGKICEYLLNALHPDNGGKAQFFAGLGFSREKWRALADAFVKLALEFEAVSMESSHCIKYIVDGALTSPSGKSLTVRTVWIVDQGHENPRLVTAYPREEV